jgi:hypothetical protein
MNLEDVMFNSMSNAQMILNQTQTIGALALFRRAFAKGKMDRLLAFLINKNNHLLSIEQISKGKEFYARNYCGLKTVPIKMIRGSEGRSEDFDRSFNPIKKHNMYRWMGVATLRLKGRALPAVDLVQIGELFFVMDGHHRISVAWALGEKFIDANVTVWKLK